MMFLIRERAVMQTYLSGHDEAGRCGVDGDISGHQTHVLKLFVHLAVLLITQSFDGAGEDHTLLLSQSQSNGIPAHTQDSNYLIITVRLMLQNLSK